MPQDLTTLLSKFLVSLWNGLIYNAVLGGSTIGIPAIVKNTEVTGQTAANASICTYTVGAADGLFEVAAYVRVTASTTHSFSAECAYTDVGNNARVIILDLNGPSAQYSTLIANAAGAIDYAGRTHTLKAKAATTITIRTNSGGTYTSVTYNAGGIIKQVA